MSTPLLLAQNAVFTIPITALPDGTQSVTLTLDRCTPATALLWALASVSVQVDMQVSYDGGVTWAYGGGFTANGGQFTLADGSAETAVGGKWTYPQPPTHVQGTITALGGALSSGYTLTAA